MGFVYALIAVVPLVAFGLYCKKKHKEQLEDRLAFDQTLDNVVALSRSVREHIDKLECDIRLLREQLEEQQQKQRG